MRLSQLVALIVIVIIVATTILAVNFIHCSSFKFRPHQEICFKNFTPTTPSASSNLTQTSHQQRCMILNHPYCLDLELPYRTTALPLPIAGINFPSVDEVQTFLSRWKSVQQLPECWPVLKVALCSIMMPQCLDDTVTGKIERVSLPNVDICHDLTQKNKCKFIERHYGWPSIFNCTDANIYQKNCSNELRDLKMDYKPASCNYPLVSSSHENSWFKDIKGCGLHCKYPVLDYDDQANISWLIKWFVILGCIFTTISIGLFIGNSKRSMASRIAKVIILCTISHLFNYVGWSIQLIFNQPISCNTNGGLLYGVPLVANACTISSILTYASSLESLVMTAYLANLCSQKIAGSKNKSNEFSTHLISYVIFIFVFIIAASAGQVDGNGPFGICTIGNRSIYSRFIFIIIPKIALVIYGNFYFSSTILEILKSLRVQSSKERQMPPDTRLPPEKRLCLKRNLLRFVLMVALTSLEAITATWNSVYDHLNNDNLLEQIDQFTACSLNLRDLYDVDIKTDQCIQPTRPLIILYYLELSTKLSQGIVVATWALTKQNFRALLSKINQLVDKNRHLQNQYMGFDNDGRPLRLMDGHVENSPADLIDMTADLAGTSGKNDKLELYENGRGRNVPGTPSSLRSATISQISQSTTSIQVTGSTRLTAHKYFARHKSRRYAEPPPIVNYPPQDILSNYFSNYLTNETLAEFLQTGSGQQWTRKLAGLLPIQNADLIANNNQSSDNRPVLKEPDLRNENFGFIHCSETEARLITP